MRIGQIVFSQVIEHLPLHTFRRCVQRYDGNHKIKSFAQALIKIARPLCAEEDLGLDLRGNIPTFIHISGGKLHDVNVLDILIPEPASSPSIN